MFTDYLKGKIKYKAELKSPEKFLNTMRNSACIKEIALHGEGVISFCCFYREEKTVENALLDNGGKIIYKKLSGMPKILKKLKLRPGIVFGFALSIILMFTSTFFVWDIRVKGNEKLSDAEIIKILKQAGLSEGMFIKGIDVKSIANKVLINDERLSWIAVNFEGTVATAEVKEASIPKREVKKENVNIVASNNGIVMRIDALDGDALVNNGDSVYKGQLLISSFSEKRTGGSILKGAKGFVWAVTERNFCVTVPLEYCDKNESDNKRITYTIDFLGKTIDIPTAPKKQFENSTRYSEKLNMRLSEKIVLPFECVRLVECEYKPYKKRRTEKEATELARKTAKESLFQTCSDFTITSVTEDINVSDDVLTYTCTFEGIENIARELEFELS